MTAAATRKLQKEIENVLKKVDDGIQEFAETWAQATAAGSGQQRERLGEELKKSINKLQRLRVQIREWLAQGSVPASCKDKLEDSRRKVEADMQRFKEFERDLKTKAFSTCALAKDDDLDLEEAEKIKNQDWCAHTLQALKDQLDQFEADLEVLGNKRSLSSADKTRQTQLKTLQDQHNFHVRKLELVLRAVDNDALDLSELACVRDCIDFYVENNEESECYHDETVYDCFDLTEFEEKVFTPKGAPLAAMMQRESSGATATKEDSVKKAKDKEKAKKEEKKAKKKEDKKSTTAQAGVNSAKSASGKAGAGDAAVSPAEAKDPELDEMKVQEDQLLSEAAEFICKICQVHVAGCGPKLTSCSHLFCGDCIAQWFNQHPESQTWAQRAKQAGPDRVVPCPVCKQPLNEKKDLYPVCGVTSRSENLLLWRMLSSLKIMCFNHPKVRPDGKCEWIGEYGSYQKHAATCKNQSGDAVSVSEVTTHHRPSALSVDSESDACSTPMSRQHSVKSNATPMNSSFTPTAASPQVRQTSPTMSSPGVSPQGKPPASPVSEAPRPSGSGGSGGDSGGPSQRIIEASLAAPEERKRQPAAAAAEPVAAAAPPSEAVDAGASGRQTSAEAAPAKDTSFTVRAVGSFERAGENMVVVSTGDLIKVFEQHVSGWAYAKNLSVFPSGSGPCGWIPSWIAPQPEEAQPARAAAQHAAPAAPAPVANAGAVSPAATKNEGRQILQACSTFAAATASQLSLTPQDMVEVVERHASGWTYGRKVTDTHTEGAAEGWFPDWVVAQK